MPEQQPDALPREVHEHLRRLTRKFWASRRVLSDLDFALKMRKREQAHAD